MVQVGNKNISPVFGTNDDDNIRATGRDDVVSGASGDDYIQGLSGNDEIFGGTGNDILLGQNGNDVIYGNGKPAFVDMSKLKIVESRTATVTFMNEGAGYRNSLGVYEYDEDGNISNVQILFANASKQHSGGNLVAGESEVTFDVAAGSQVGFFVVSNGYGKGSENREALEAEGGYFELRHTDGSAGNINNGPVELYHIAENGDETHVNSQYGNDLYHSASSASSGHDLNPDNYEHVVGRALSVSGELLIGFEDLRGGGDNDYDDTVIRVDLGFDNILAQLPEYTGQGGNKPDDDILHGGNGNDVLYGIGGDDILTGGNGDDELNGNSGNDILYGNNGNDLLVGNSGNDILAGGNGNDELHGNSGDDQLSGNDGTDILVGHSGNDYLSGGAGSDILDGSSGNDEVHGDSGNDTLNGGSGDDILYGGSGNDIVNGGSDQDTIHGGNGADLLNGNSGDDIINGDEGNDELNGHSGDDTLNGGSGGDRIVGGGGDDIIDGGEHNDKLYGGSGNDTIIGGVGNDYINAGSGDDVIDAGIGRDKIIGGSGSDIFVFGDYQAGDLDRVSDFSTEDILDLTYFDYHDFDALFETATESSGHTVFDLAEDYTLRIDNFSLQEFEVANLDDLIFI